MLVGKALDDPALLRLIAENLEIARNNLNLEDEPSEFSSPELQASSVPTLLEKV